mgnify:CR=1 FL=1
MLIIVLLFVVCNGFHLQKSLTRKTNLYDTINTEKFQKYEKYLTPEPLNELLEDIENEKASSLYFSSDLRKLYSNQNKDLYNPTLEEVYVTNINPGFADKLVSSAKDHHIKTFVLPDAPSFNGVLNTANGLFSSLFNLTFIVVLIMSILSSRNMRNSGLPDNMSPPFSSTPFFKDNSVKQDKDNMIKANVSLSDWAGSPEIFEECNEVVSYLRNDTNYRNDQGSNLHYSVRMYE